MSNSTVLENYYLAQLSALHVRHSKQLQRLDEEMVSKEQSILSLERTAEDQSATISQLRSQIIAMDKELNSLKTPSDAEAGEQKAPEPERGEDERQCDCTACQIRRALEDGRANDVSTKEVLAKVLKIKEDANEEIPAPIRKIAEMLGAMEGVEGVSVTEVKV